MNLHTSIYLFAIICSIAVILYIDLLFIFIMVLMKLFKTKTNNHLPFKQQINKYINSQSIFVKIENKIILIMICSLFYFLFFLGIFYGEYFLGDTFNLKYSTDAIGETINSFSTTIYSFTTLVLSLIIICTSINKKHYIVFNIEDISNMYGIRFISINLFVVLMLTVLNQIYYTLFENEISFFSIFPLIILSLLFSSYLVIRFLFILFPNSMSELKLLNRLYKKFYKIEFEFAKSRNRIGLKTNEDYLISKYILNLRRIYKKYDKNFSSSLTLYAFNAQYAIRKPFFNLLKICKLFKSFIFNLFISLYIALLTTSRYIFKYPYLFLIIFILCFVITTLITIISLLIFIKTKFKNELITILFGKHLFSFATKRGKEKVFFSNTGLSAPYYYRENKWLHSIINLLALFIIWTNTSNHNIEENAKIFIKYYRENVKNFYYKKTVNPFIEAPILLCLFHLYNKDKEIELARKLFNHYNINYNNQLYYVTLSVTVALYDNQKAFNQFIKELELTIPRRIHLSSSNYSYKKSHRKSI